MNSKNRILLFSHDAGGANEVMSYGFLKSKEGYEVIAYPKGPAINIFEQHIPNLIAKEPFSLQENDIIITGTSGIHSNYELEITKEANNLNIEVITLLDSTDELLTRFTFNGETTISKKYLPSKIITNQKNFISEIQEIDHRLTYHKSYYLYYLKNFFYKNSIPITHSIIKRYEGEYILLVTEYFQELFGNLYGFDEFGLCKNIFEAVKEINPEIPILLKTHPAENENKFDSLIKQYQLKIIRSNFIIQEAVKYSKCVFGINSSVFKDSTLINKPTFSIQINATKNLNTILEKDYIIKSMEALKTVLLKLYS